MSNLRYLIVVGMCVMCVQALLISSPIPCNSAEKIILAGAQDTKESFHGRWLALIYTEVFHRLSYELQYNGYPSARASKISDNGKVDGEINRVSGYQSTHPNLIRVDESHFPTKLFAYAVKPGITLYGWNSLKNTDYIVEYRRGTKVAEIGLTSFVKAENLSAIATAERGLKRLIMGRIDLYIGVETLVTEQLMKIDPDKFDTSAVYKAGLMVEDTLHVFLHKKNATLVPKIADVLKAMKQEGLIEQYRQIALEQK